MPINSRNESAQCVSMTWRATFGCPYTADAKALVIRASNGRWGVGDWTMLLTVGPASFARHVIGCHTYQGTTDHNVCR
jgi:hypothetical protein